jgi:AbrB family looped-hinge helix DNA binding protein
MQEISTMPLVKVKERFQVTIPTDLRETIRLKVGDILEATIENEKIVLIPKVVVDKVAVDAKIQEGLKAVKEGKMTPAFSSMKEYQKYRAKNKKQ